MPQNYGTPEFYKELFQDILADVGNGTYEQNTQTGINIMEGFRQAIQEWLDWHQQAAQSYDDLKDRFRDWTFEEVVMKEADSLPEIPSWPKLYNKEDDK